jgi:hypothetical protein
VLTHNLGYVWVAEIPEQFGPCQSMVQGTIKTVSFRNIMEQAGCSYQFQIYRPVLVF